MNWKGSERSSLDSAGIFIYENHKIPRIAFKIGHMEELSDISKEAGFSETSMILYQNTRDYIPESSNIPSHHRQNPTSHVREQMRV
jgi:hypothetical protein